ncbi:hypothetical protein C1H46_028662 [Malus baccata]|uniref:Uncharacterized protein n=1 Tax=Malus baccata TaxID=106549 RepID=A0A540LGZ2_MALBA|nr:hypothetical protein C1H46_028662 [Malus baccata]
MEWLHKTYRQGRQEMASRLFVENTIDNVIHTAAYAKIDYIRDVRESINVRGSLLPLPGCKLNISTLMDLTYETLAYMIARKTLDIRKTFNDQHQERLLHPRGKGGRSLGNQWSGSLLE